MNLSKNEEDYLKALFFISEESDGKKVGTNYLAEHLNVSPASVNSMIKKLKSKEFVIHEKYGKLELSESGRKIALFLIRKHRLWETFLCKYMNFTWDEVHDVAEQLEHIRSPKLIRELDRFLGYPTHDPHGDSIPSESGQYETNNQLSLVDAPVGVKCRLAAVKDSSSEFLQYVSQLGLALSTEIQIVEKRPFDNSLVLQFGEKTESVSRKFAENVFVEIA